MNGEDKPNELRTDQKFARWMLPQIADAKAGYEGRLCMMFNTLKLQWSVDQIRAVSKIAKRQTFNTVDHLNGWFVNALRNLEKGRALDDDWKVVARNRLAPPDETGFRDLVPVWFAVNRKGVERGPFATRVEAEKAGELP